MGMKGFENSRSSLLPCGGFDEENVEMAVLALVFYVFKIDDSF
jgi:hypothetical protein